MESTSEEPGSVNGRSRAEWFLGLVARTVARAWVAEHGESIAEHRRPLTGGERPPGAVGVRSAIEGGEVNR